MAVVLPAPGRGGYYVSKMPLKVLAALGRVLQILLSEVLRMRTLLSQTLLLSNVSALVCENI